jgi:beta-xylosidase
VTRVDGYRNPVLPGFHPDPSVCRVGDEYFLVTSTFTWFPGVPIFRSRNLVDWTPIGHVLDRPSQLDLGVTHGWGSMGVYAPTLRHHDGRFFMITTNVTHGGARNFFVTADDPAGPWSEPVMVGVAGIDPDLAWDADGTCWLHFSRAVDIARCRIDDTTGAVLDGPEPTWSGTGLQYPEAPHLYERDGTWYLMIAEGGTHEGHAVSIARGP